MKKFLLIFIFLLLDSSFADSRKKDKEKSPIAKLKVTHKKCASPCANALDGAKATDSLPIIDDGDVIPPMPDKEVNDSTLLGVDVDGDGVRDDVELWINSNVSESPEERKAFKQMFKASQQALINAENRELSRKISNLLGEALSCAFAQGGKGDANFNRVNRLRKSFKSQILNTRIRIQANIKFNDQLAGTGTPPRVMQLRREKRSLTELCE